MESESAKTLRAMSDDHRMVPDFSEKLLDIADAIERLQKEVSDSKSKAEFWRSEACDWEAEVERLSRMVAHGVLELDAWQEFKEHLEAKIDKRDALLKVHRDHVLDAAGEAALQELEANA